MEKSFNKNKVYFSDQFDRMIEEGKHKLYGSIYDPGATNSTRKVLVHRDTFNLLKRYFSKYNDLRSLEIVSKISDIEKTITE
jgi:hypothetical protein